MSLAQHAEGARRAEEKQADLQRIFRKFAAMHETLKIDDNAFDYIMYTYGLV